ncbi:MAG: endopeptidase La [Limnochordaceae bacterium]|nr:endopeptidase La [Limnochordaceae bacterium]
MARPTFSPKSVMNRALPLLPLRGIVLFPGQAVAIEVGRPRSMEAIRQALLRDGLLVVVAQRDSSVVEPSREDLFDVGTLARLHPSSGLAQLIRQQAASGEARLVTAEEAAEAEEEEVTGEGGGSPEGNAAFRVILEGLERVDLRRVWQTPYPRATVYFRLESKPPAAAAGTRPARRQAADAPAGQEAGAEVRLPVADLSALVRRQIGLYLQAGRVLPGLEDFRSPELDSSPGRLANLLAGRLPLAVEVRQQLLETDDPEARLRKVYEALVRETELAGVEQRVKERVRQQMESSQREYFLREQMRAIQRELGEGDGNAGEVAALRKKLEEVGLSPEAKERATQELDRLAKMPPLVPEATVIRSYLEWIAALPWQKQSKDRLDLDLARKILERDHYGLEEPKRRILEFLAVRRLTATTRGSLLCLVGPPGVGKTSLARSIAEALDRRFVRISLGGIRDEAEIRGHRRTYVGALPGRILHAMRQAGTKNPVLLLDEIDKMGADFRGDPAAALLEVLDPEQNKAFSDHYLELPFDLSQVLFITTANYLGGIPRPLLDRMELIEISGYTEEEKFQIGRRYLWPRQLRESGLNGELVHLSDGALMDIIQHYTREAGVRQLERVLARLCRRIALDWVEREASQKPARVNIGRRSLPRYLGPARVRWGEALSQDRIGVATGLAYTETGGDLLEIEVAVSRGSGRLILTGKLGEVMRESAQTAFSFIRTRSKTLGITADFPDHQDIHIHVPEGAIPKDGPSAGITIATALASALTGRAVRHDLAMTGEITLQGRILPIGGLKEKLLAAVRAGLRQVLIPAENEPELVQMPESVSKRLQIRLVETMDEVLEAALLPATSSCSPALAARPAPEVAAAADSVVSPEPAPCLPVNGERPLPQPQEIPPGPVPPSPSGVPAVPASARPSAR